MSPQRRADLAYFAAILIGVAFIVLMGPLTRRLEMVHTNDFSGIWSGPATILVGVNPWDPVRYVPSAIALRTKTPDALVVDYMPWEVVAVLPLGALPLETAAWIWMIGSMGLSALALRALLRTFLPGREDPGVPICRGSGRERLRLRDRGQCKQRERRTRGTE